MCKNQTTFCQLQVIFNPRYLFSYILFSFSCLLFISCTDAKIDNKQHLKKGLTEQSELTIKLEGDYIELEKGPDRLECVLKVAMDADGIQENGDAYHHALKNELLYEHNLGAMTGYRHIISNQTKENIQLENEEYEFYKLVPSYFDCKLSKFIFEHIFKQYYSTEIPKVGYMNQKKYFTEISRKQ